MSCVFSGFWLELDEARRNNGVMLKGKTIVITGSARGVGADIAIACAQHGANLLLGDILVEAGEAVAHSLVDKGASARFHPLDLADPSSIQAFADSIGAREGRIHGLVNNGAIATNVGGRLFEDIDIDLWDRVMRVNIRGAWLMTRAMSPLFDPAGGQIVNVASDTALWGATKLLAYVASKGAILAMTRSLARELGPRRIGVTAIAPGIMRNEATEYVPAGRHELYEKGRAVPGPQFPSDIVETVAFLLSPAALALTGQTLPVNAGFVFA